MRISWLPADALSSEHHQQWRALQRSNPALVSPCFCPEFTGAVAAVRDDVRVAILTDRAGIVGFFPYQKRRSVGSAVGAPLSDHHGVIAAPGTVWRWEELLAATGLSVWAFDHLPAAQARPDLLSAAPVLGESPGIDLSRGFLAWKQERRAQGARQIGELDRKARKLAREVGPLRFVVHAHDPDLLSRVLLLKSEQYRRTGLADPFAASWARALVRQILDTQGPGFGGQLSALYAGDTLVAAHLGMRAEQAWHWWFPVYERAYARHSPGALLLLRVAEAAAHAGAAVLDLGKGADAYKSSFADCCLPLAEGVTSRLSVAAVALALRRHSVRWARQAPLLQPLRPLVHSLRRLRHTVAPGTAASPLPSSTTATPLVAHSPADAVES
jgi:CelD/BcsL family acetyltransferase involved in cellulose biosynthesis